MAGVIPQKLWGGRFTEDIDPDFHNLNASIHIDKRLYAEDIQGSIAYARVLCKAKLISQEEMQAIETAFKQVLIARAEEDIDVLMPGYTHMQRAQPIRWSQWLLSYAWYAKQDLERLLEVRKRVNILPLGSGAIAGNPFAIDRQFLAMELGFDEITENSMHTVGDRDFAAEFLFWSSLSSMHLSRFCEDLIIYSTQEFNFVQFADKYSTGSSLMPQKRNPDCMELIRGKTGTIFGKCIGFMVTLKGIPSTYNKDLQEDKESLFYTYDTLYQVFHIAEKALATLKVNRKSCEKALTSDMLATDMAYYLVNKGISFRESHHLVGKAVALAESKGIPLLELSVQQLKTISEVFEESVSCIWNFNSSVDQYKIAGGTSFEAVQQQINSLRCWLRNYSFKE